MDAPHAEPHDVARIDVFLDDAAEPFQSAPPPVTIGLDTTGLDDGEHVLRLEARDAGGRVGRRTIPFVVQNGPGITVTGLRARERVGGSLQLAINSFSGEEPFDPIRAESRGPIPVWTWVMALIIAGWAGWYGLAFFATPPTFASTPTYESHPVEPSVGGGGTSGATGQNPVAAAQAPLTTKSAPVATGKGSAAGFDYAANGPQLYTQNCAACHGASGAGVPGAFPPLAADPVVNARNPEEHIAAVLRGLKAKAIGGTTYASQMPGFSQLSDHDIAAIIDHERTSWGNQAPVITPADVKHAR
jgi:mono/diheme cytochrome c family protein